MAGCRSGRWLVRLHRHRELLVSLISLEQKRRGSPRLFSFLGSVKPSEARADTDSVSLTLHPPARVAALVGALVLTGLAAVVFLLGRGALGSDSAPAAPAPVVTSKPTPSSATTPKPHPAAKAAKRARVASGFPARIDHALRYSRVVVVSVSIPGAPVDRVVRSEARSAARASRAGFVAISALDERAVGGLVAKTGVLPDPAVVIVKRPGTVAATFSVADAGTIAQAVAEARR